MKHKFYRLTIALIILGLAITQDSVTNPDGSVTVTQPDGTKTTTNTDGTTIVETPDGIKTTTRPDGTVITQQADGTTITRNPDGSTTTVNPDGTTSSTPATNTANPATGGTNCLSGSCVKCVNNGCIKCIGRKKNTANRLECKDTISETRCRVWSDPPHDYCVQCDWFYMLNERNRCVKGRNMACVQGTRVGDQELCNICSDTLPNWERTRCNKRLEIPNCRWGYRNGELEACAYCKRGYSVYGYGCVPNCVHGCSHCVKRSNGTQWVQVCDECDHRRGWFMTSENVCTGSVWVKAGIWACAVLGISLAGLLE